MAVLFLCRTEKTLLKLHKRVEESSDNRFNNRLT